MSWRVEYLPEARKDMRRLDDAQRLHVAKAVKKVSTNPYPCASGSKGRIGYGKPLGNKHGYDLTGLAKVKLKRGGTRIVYKLEERDGVMAVIVVGVRADDEVYRRAAERLREDPV